MVVPAYRLGRITRHFIHFAIGLGAQGCLLLGYDPLSPTQEEEPSAAAPDAAVGPPAGRGGPLDAGGQAGVGAIGMRADTGPVGITDVALSSDSGTADASDANALADGAAESACPGSENECGGCDALRAEVGSPCGRCGLGFYACDGSEDVLCENADARPVAIGDDMLIDDFEDGDGYVEPREDRSGAWFVTHDATQGVLSQRSSSEFAPSADGAGGSAYAARLWGNGFSDWGATLAVSLSAHGCSYDASVQRGIAFWARGTGTAQVSIATRQTVPVAEGGSCFGNCYDHFGSTIVLQPNWTPYQVPWSVLVQGGWGTPALFDPSALVYLELGFGPNAQFDIQLDDLRFF